MSLSIPLVDEVEEDVKIAKLLSYQTSESKYYSAWENKWLQLKKKNNFLYFYISIYYFVIIFVGNFKIIAEVYIFYNFI